jgi:CheY-like chemotaxis protein
LLADDSVTIQRVIELTFADEDIKVVAVSDGDQAIQKLDTAPPDIVLADIGMPGKNGYEVARYIRQTPRLSHIPVVLLTGAFEPVDQARASEAGCDGVLAKPFEPQLVIGRVKELLAKGRDAGASGQWAPQVADPVLGATAAPPASGPIAPPLDDYFDRLDAAFSTATAPAAVAPPATTAAAPAPAPAEIDWFSEFSDVPSAPCGAPEPWDLAPAARSTTSSDDLPLAPVSPAPDAPLVVPSFPDVAEPKSAASPAEAPHAPAPTAAEPGVTAPSHAPSPLPPLVSPAALPSLADAFAALLAAEQGDAASATALAWPGTKRAPAAATDELVADVTRRVLDAMSDRVVRDTVADIVSQIAERLVREEIDRIKSSVK